MRIERMYEYFILKTDEWRTKQLARSNIVIKWDTNVSFVEYEL